MLTRLTVILACTLGLCSVALAADAPARRGCVTRLTVGELALRGDCIRATPQGWDITTKQLRVGRETLTPRDPGTARFSIRTTASGPVLHGPAVTAQLLDGPAGDRATGVLDLRGAGLALRPGARLDGVVALDTQPIHGTIALHVAPASGRWHARGRIHMRLWVLDDAVDALVDGRTAAGCVAAGRGFGIEARYRYADARVTGAFHTRADCSDRLGPPRALALDSHDGEFARSVPPSGGATTDSFVVPSGVAGEQLEIGGAGALPVVTVTSPSGVELTTPASPGVTATAGAAMIGAVAPDGRHQLVLLRRPQAGTWLITLRPGSPAVTGVTTRAAG